MSDEEILAWRQLVYNRANHWKRSNPDIPREDLEQEGWLGVMEAERYDASFGATLQCFVWQRIDSKILDYLRNFYQSFPVRGSRRKKTEHYKSMVAAEDALHLVDSHASRTESRVIAKITVDRALNACGDRERDLLQRHFGIGFTQAELAECYRLVPSRISQLITQGKRKCREAAGSL